MADPLLFTIGLSVVLLLGALFICKSALSVNEKINSILVILALFCLVSIVNAAKHKKEGTPYHGNQLQKNCTGPPNFNYNIQYTLPALETSRDFVTKSLKGWDPETASSYQFAFLFSERKVGKTTSIKEYAKELQQLEIPTIYLSINNSNTNISQFLMQYCLPNLNTFDEIVEKSNKGKKVPSVFIDNIENAFIESNGEYSCPLCEYFKALFDQKQVNIFFISNNAETKDLLKADESFNKRMTFYEFHERNFEDVDDYLLEKINTLIKNDEKKFTSEAIRTFIRIFNWDFQVLSEYIHNIKSYDNVKDFIEKQIQAKTQEISQSDLKDILRVVVDLAKQRGGNVWLPYANLKTRYENSPAEKLQEALKKRILTKKENLYKFRNYATYQAALDLFGLN